MITTFYNHHEAHALPALFYSPWENALIATADGGGDNVHYSHRHFAAGRLATIYGGEDTVLVRPDEDSLGKMYGWATKALGFKRVRHEGKVTGLAAMGEPVRANQLASHYRVDGQGRVHSDLGGDKTIYAFMRALGRGRIVHVGSIHSLVASPYKSAYVAAKHGLVGLARTLALETADCDVTVNVVCPAYVRTQLVENQIAAQARERGITPEQVIEQVMLRQMPKRRFIEIDEIAGTVDFLASDAARNITGQCITLDGGWTAQ